MAKKSDQAVRGGPSCARIDEQTRESRDAIERLREMLERYQRRRGGGMGDRGGIVSTGIEGIDAMLPGGGLPTGSVVEVLSGGSGIGARTLAIRAAIAAAGLDADLVGLEVGRAGLVEGQGVALDSVNGVALPSVTKRSLAGQSVKALALSHKSVNSPALSKWVVVVDCAGDFYPPAAVAMGVPVGRLVVVRTRKPVDAFWATDQALRCEAVGAVIATRLALDAAGSRRLQLAAEGSGGMGLILSPAEARRQSFAAVQILIEPVAQCLNRAPTSEEAGHPLYVEYTRLGRGYARWARVTLLKVRDGMPVGPVVVGWSDESFDVPLRSIPADRTAGGGRRRSA